jgi:two-component system response regulator YesN
MSAPDLTHDIDHIWDLDNRELLRRHYIVSLYSQNENPGDSFENVNKMYNVNFREGLFCLYYIKIDIIQGLDRNRYLARYHGVHSAFLEITRQKFAHLCNDMLYRTMRDGLAILLNYEPEIDFSVRSMTRPYFEYIKAIAKKSKILVTLCVSGNTPALERIIDLYSNVYTASWTRYFHGKGKILYYEKPKNPLDLIWRDKIDALLVDIRRTTQLYYEKELRQCFEKFFSFPPKVLCRVEARIFLNEVRDYIVDISKIIIQDHTKYDNELENLAFDLHMAPSLALYKEVYIERLVRLIRLCADINNKQQRKEITQAIAFIQGNYGKPILIADVARKVKLSSVYFCALFKRETGINFGDYLADCRMTIAKQLLRKSDMNISEIADAVSFSDVRYFSRIFKKWVGMRPSEYKKLFD